MSNQNSSLRVDSLISIGEAADITSYSSEFIRMLARSGKLSAVKVGRDWMTTRDAIHQYLSLQQQRHQRSLNILRNAQRRLK